MRLWIGNIEPDTSDDELKALIGKYAQLSCETIERVEGAGNRPAAMVQFTEASRASLDSLSRRLNGMYWKGRALVSTVYMF
jgi:RNA recognition motif